MNERIENLKSSSIRQTNLDNRTDAELKKSILDKRLKGLPLDEKENAFLTQQMAEDKEDRDRTYRS